MGLRLRTELSSEQLLQPIQMAVLPVFQTVLEISKKPAEELRRGWVMARMRTGTGRKPWLAIWVAVGILLIGLTSLPARAEYHSAQIAISVVVPSHCSVSANSSISAISLQHGESAVQVNCTAQTSYQIATQLTSRNAGLSAASLTAMPAMVRMPVTQPTGSESALSSSGQESELLVTVAY